MSFLRKLFGSGDKPARPSTRRAASPHLAGRPSPEPGDTPAPRIPTLAESSPRALHAYFEYVGGGSSKFYAVSLEEEDGETWASPLQLRADRLPPGLGHARGGRNVVQGRQDL
jgi:hypothetical protein